MIDDVPARLDDAERGLHLLGIVGMADPPREASAPSIAACRDAGIRPIMITGDHALTGEAIARRTSASCATTHAASPARSSRSSNETQLSMRSWPYLAVFARTSRSTSSASWMPGCIAVRRNRRYDRRRRQRCAGAAAG